MVDIVQETSNRFLRERDEADIKVRKQEEEAEVLKAEAEVLKAKLLHAEVAKERAEEEAKKLVEHKDKWERLAKKAKEEKEELEKYLRQQLREVKLAAKRAPTTTAATQTQQTPPPQLNSTTTQTEKPTYACVATQFEKEGIEKGKGKGKASVVTSASVVEDVVMKDWSPYDRRMRRRRKHWHHKDWSPYYQSMRRRRKHWHHEVHPLGKGNHQHPQLPPHGPVPQALELSWFMG